MPQNSKINIGTVAYWIFLYGLALLVSGFITYVAFLILAASLSGIALLFSPEPPKGYWFLNLLVGCLFSVFLLTFQLLYNIFNHNPNHRLTFAYANTFFLSTVQLIFANLRIPDPTPDNFDGTGMEPLIFLFTSPRHIVFWIPVALVVNALFFFLQRKAAPKP